MRGWPPLVEAFAAGKFNLVHLLNPIPIWMRYNNHYPVKSMAWAHTNGSSVVVGQASGSNRSRTLAASRSPCRSGIRCTISCCNMPCVNSASNRSSNPKARRWRTTNAICKLWRRPKCPRLSLLKEIDGYIVAELFDALGELKAGGRILRFTGDIWNIHPCCVVCMHEAVVGKKPEWTQKVINALVLPKLMPRRVKMWSPNSCPPTAQALPSAACAGHRTCDDGLRHLVLWKRRRDQASAMEFGRMISNRGPTRRRQK